MTSKINRRQTLVSMAASLAVATLPVCRVASAAAQLSPAIAAKCEAALSALHEWRKANAAFEEFKQQRPFGLAMPILSQDFSAFRRLRDRYMRTGEELSRATLQAVWTTPVSHADCDALIRVAGYLEERHPGYFDHPRGRSVFDLIEYGRSKLDA